MRVLAGPMVRRVEPRLAAIWVATDAACKVDLDIWNGIMSVASLPASQYHAGADALRAGAGLYIALVVADLSAAPTPLEPEVVYSYNLTFSPASGGKETLDSLKLLQTRTTPKPHLALGYQDGALPSFVLPPRQLKDLKILHGSCRRVGFDAPDAMAWVDDILVDTRADAVQRPHQLFLTGDQIYADNLPSTMQQLITPIGNTLIGSVEKLPIRFPLEPGQSGINLHDCTLENFPAGLRKNLILYDAGMSTSDGKNHLLSFGEFCAMYLMIWCNELWPDPKDLPAATTVYPQITDADKLNGIWALHLGLVGDYASKQKSPYIHSPLDPNAKSLPQSLNLVNANKVLEFFTKKFDTPPPKPVTEIYDDLEIFNDDLRITQDFMKDLPRVRRALANIASYTIFDDHEITDDWNFAKPWKDRVLSSPLGSAILRNGLLSYTLFQGWGNDPKQFLADVRDPQGNVVASSQKQLLNAIPLLFPDGESMPPAAGVANQADKLLGLYSDPATPTDPPQNPPPVTWHYRVGGPRHLVLVLDVRTRRFQVGRTAAPQNLSADAVKAQIPTDTDPALMNLSPDIDVVLVISSLVVMGPPIFDDLFGPASYKLFDLKDHGNRADLPATNPDAIESWPNDPVGFERLLNALQPLKRVVLLSGDVHYATTVAMSYWKNRLKPPSRYAQFVCSALKNDFDSTIARANQRYQIFQRVLQLQSEVARIGWNNFTSDLLNIPAGAKLAPALSARLQEAPIMLPTLGWPAGTLEKPSNPPDWAWRIHIVRDERLDSQRPMAQRTEQLYPDSPAHDATLSPDAYPQIAVRHAKQLDNMNFSRQMLFNVNVGAIRFEKNDNVVTAIHQLYSTHPKALLPGKAEIYMEHRVDLDTPLEVPPAIGAPENP